MKQGISNEPELLYQPYRLETPAGDLAIVFRDHRLSDLIGFTYSSMPAETSSSGFGRTFTGDSTNNKERVTANNLG